jgi:hypothetical protein
MPVSSVRGAPDGDRLRGERWLASAPPLPPVLGAHPQPQGTSTHRLSTRPVLPTRDRPAHLPRTPTRRLPRRLNRSCGRPDPRSSRADPKPCRRSQRPSPTRPRAAAPVQTGEAGSRRSQIAPRKTARFPITRPSRIRAGSKAPNTASTCHTARHAEQLDMRDSCRSNYRPEAAPNGVVIIPGLSAATVAGFRSLVKRHRIRNGANNPVTELWLSLPIRKWAVLT